MGRNAPAVREFSLRRCFLVEGVLFQVWTPEVPCSSLSQQLLPLYLLIAFLIRGGNPQSSLVSYSRAICFGSSWEEGQACSCFLSASDMVVWGAFWATAFERRIENKFHAYRDVQYMASNKPCKLHFRMLKESLNPFQNNNYWLSSELMRFGLNSERQRWKT